MKTESSDRYVLIDDFLAGELRRWKEHQAVNEISAGGSYVHIYKDADDKIIQQSKGLGEVAIEKVFLVCTRAVAGRLGHSNTPITQNLYMHNTQKLQENIRLI